MLKTGVIEPFMTAWAAPIVLGQKKDRLLRFLIDLGS